MRKFFSNPKLATLGIAVIVLATASNVESQPIYDVCMHKKGGNFNTDGDVEMQFEFEGKRGKTYIYEFNGPQQFWRGQYYEVRSETTVYKNQSDGLVSHRFFWDSSASPRAWSFSCSIYEQNSRGEKGDWVGSVDLYSYQEAALVYAESEKLCTVFDQYYCTIDWDPGLNTLDGYYQGCWYWMSGWPSSGWQYQGDVGSPRYDYGSTSYRWIYYPWFSPPVGPPPPGMNVWCP